MSIPTRKEVADNLQAIFDYFDKKASLLDGPDSSVLASEEFILMTKTETCQEYVDYYDKEKDDV